MGLFSDDRAQLQEARAEAARVRKFGAQAMQEVDTAKQQAQAAERARMEVSGMLGAPGTYDLPGSSSGGSGGSGALDTSSLFTKGKLSESAKSSLAGYDKERGRNVEFLGTDDPNKLLQTGEILDPDAYANEISKTSDFRIRSRLTAEAEQLLNREGPAWHRMNEATIGQIVQGAAAARREEERAIKNAAAKGGSARRNAMIQAQSALVRERANTMRIEQTWKANMALDEYVRNNADAVGEGNARFLNNLPMLRESYQNTMSNLAEMMAGVQVSAANLSIRASEGQQKYLKESSVVGKLIGAGIAIVGGALTGGAGAALGAGLAAVGGMVGGEGASQADYNAIGGAITGKVQGAYNNMFGTPMSNFTFSSPTPGSTNYAMNPNKIKLR